MVELPNFKQLYLYSTTKSIDFLLGKKIRIYQIQLFLSAFNALYSYGTKMMFLYSLSAHKTRARPFAGNLTQVQ